MSDTSKTLLIIEDSASIIWRLISFLQEIENLIVLGSVRNGTSGLKRILKEKPDVILLDVHLPGISGLKIIEELKKGNYAPYIIVFTNNSNLYFKDRAFELGADEFYDKSVQFEETINSVSRFCCTKKLA